MRWSFFFFFLGGLHEVECQRAALVLRGMSAAENGRGPIDWRASRESLWAMYVEPRQAAHYIVDVYYHTYRSAVLGDVDAAYAPIRRRATKHFVSKNRFAAHQTSLLTALETVVDPARYDEICVARFDLLLQKPVANWNLDAESFNVPWRDLTKGKHCDVLWIFPGSVVPEIVADLKELLQHPPHNNCCGGELHFYHPTSLPMHYMFDGQFSSDTDWPEKFTYNVNPLYKLHRTRGGGNATQRRRPRRSSHKKTNKS